MEIGCVLEVIAVISGQVRTWLRTWTRIRTWTAARHVADLCSHLRYAALWVDALDDSGLPTELADWLLTDGLDLLTELPEGPELDRALDGLEILEFAREYR